MTGTFITFEGGEGCGKSLQARALVRRLDRMGLAVLPLHEPGGTRLGRAVSYWLKWDRAGHLPPLTELLLFNASRSLLVADVIRPALTGGKVVICDRFADSTIAYQGYGRGLDLGSVRHTCDLATDGLRPDLTLLLDVPVEEGLRRKAQMRAQADRFEQETLAFHQRIRAGYLEMARNEPGRWIVIDGGQSKDTVRRDVWHHVSDLLART